MGPVKYVVDLELIRLGVSSILEWIAKTLFIYKCTNTRTYQVYEYMECMGMWFSSNEVTEIMKNYNKKN